MTSDAEVHIDQAWDAVRDRPKVAVAIVAGSALLVGFWGGQWYAQRGARQRSAALRQHLKENGVFDSGTSTPRFSSTGKSTALLSCLQRSHFRHKPRQESNVSLPFVSNML